MGKRFFLSSLVLGVGLISPGAALAGPGGSSLPLIGHSTGSSIVDFVSGATTGSSSGVESILGAFTTTANTVFAGSPPPSVFPYTITGNETTVAANGDELFGTILPGDGNGLADNDTLTAAGTNVVTITGGTGRFAHATGSYTETYTTQYGFSSSTTVSGTVTTTTRGTINLGVGSGPPTG
jgi:hypothetical protein